MDLEKGAWFCVAGSSWSLQEEQRERNEQGRAALNCAEECVIDSGGQETHFIMEKEYMEEIYRQIWRKERLEERNMLKISSVFNQRNEKMQNI